MIKRSAVAAVAAVAAVLTLGGLANTALASGVYGNEYSNAAANPVAGYQLNNYSPGNYELTQISTYIGSNNSHSLAQLPVGSNNGFGAQVCDPNTGQAIQAGVVHTGTGTMNVDFAVGSLWSNSSSAAYGGITNGDPCQNGTLSSVNSTVTPVPLLTGVPINDTVSVQLTLDNGAARDLRGDPNHIGDWLIQAWVVGNGEYAYYSGGLTVRTKWVCSNPAHPNCAGTLPAGTRYTTASFGTEADSSAHMTPGATHYLGSEAHMRAEYNFDGTNDYTAMNLPSWTKLIDVTSTSNGDIPAGGGTTYVQPGPLHLDAFDVFEGSLVS